MSPILAIDVALLPDDSTSSFVIHLSSLIGQPRAFVLNQTGRLPHISLVHAQLVRSKLPDAVRQLAGIAVGIHPINFDIDALHVSEGRTFPGVNYGLSIRRTHELSNLAATVLDALQPAVARSSDFAEVDYVLDANEPMPNEWMFGYTRDFPTKFSTDHYDPHITLGVGAQTDLFKDPFLPRKGESHRLALCQLGTHGTCRKVLAEWQLKA